MGLLYGFRLRVVSTESVAGQSVKGVWLDALK